MRACWQFSSLEPEVQGVAACIAWDLNRHDYKLIVPAAVVTWLKAVLAMVMVSSLTIKVAFLHQVKDMQPQHDKLKPSSDKGDRKAQRAV